MDQPAVSVIIPVYNTAEYLQRCLDSVSRQRMSDFEVLIVDDGSTDGSGQIADDFSKKDSRFRVFHKENGGASSARNLGMANARGRWITFIDSDDHVSDAYLSDLYDEANVSDADIIVSGLEYFINGRKLYRSYPDIRLYGRDVIDIFTKYNVHFSSNVHQKLFRCSIIGEIRFNENIHNHEDYIFCCECFLKISSISLTSKINYFYEMRNDSLSRWINEPAREYIYLSEIWNVHSRLAARFGREICRVLPLTKFVKEYLYSLCHFEKNFMRRCKAFSRLKFKPYEIYPENPNPTFKDRVFLYAIAYRIYPLMFYIADIAVAQSNFKFVSHPAET